MITKEQAETLAKEYQIDGFTIMREYLQLLFLSYLYQGNLTVGQTWIAMVNLWDGEFITRANTTELLILATASDTCTYSSGDWNINWWDNCTISSQVNLQGNNFNLIGCGIFSMTADIINVGNRFIKKTPSNNQVCEIVRYNNAGFKY